jgi:hypothetical protein
MARKRFNFWRTFSLFVLAVTAGIVGYSAHGRYRLAKRLDAYAVTHVADQALIGAYVGCMQHNYYLLPVNSMDGCFEPLLNEFGPTAIYQLQIDLRAVKA